MKAYGTYFQNDPVHPLVYGEVDFINPPRQRLRWETLKEACGQPATFLGSIKLACLPRVYVESDGITWLFNSEYYPYPSAVRAILEARDICGIDKLMWSSDYPRTMTAITYRMSWDFIQKSPLLTEEEKQRFFHDNAHDFYRFGTLPELRPIRHMAE